MFRFLSRLFGVRPSWPARYAEGVDWFNKKHFKQAQLAWEYAYRGAEGDLRELYRGLMQLAGALGHIQHGNLSGARQLLNGARDILRALPDRLGGLRLPTVRAGIDACSDELVELEEQRKEHFAMGLVPRLDLR